MSVVSKSNKNETYLQKVTTLLTNERYMLMGSYSCTYISCLSNFNTNNVVLLM